MYQYYGHRQSEHLCTPLPLFTLISIAIRYISCSFFCHAGWLYMRLDVPTWRQLILWLYQLRCLCTLCTYPSTIFELDSRANNIHLRYLIMLVNTLHYFMTHNICTPDMDFLSIFRSLETAHFEYSYYFVTIMIHLFH